MAGVPAVFRTRHLPNINLGDISTRTSCLKAQNTHNTAL